MIKSFASKGTEDIHDGVDSKDARKTIAKDLWPVAARKLDMLDFATSLKDVASIPGNRFEKLKGDRQGQYSVRINQQFRIVFEWQDGAKNVEIIDYH